MVDIEKVAAGQYVVQARIGGIAVTDAVGYDRIETSVSDQALSIPDSFADFVQCTYGGMTTETLLTARSCESGIGVGQPTCLTAGSGARARLAAGLRARPLQMQARVASLQNLASRQPPYYLAIVLQHRHHRYRRQVGFQGVNLIFALQLPNQ